MLFKLYERKNKNIQKKHNKMAEFKNKRTKISRKLKLIRLHNLPPQLTITIIINNVQHLSPICPWAFNVTRGMSTLSSSESEHANISFILQYK